MPRFSFPGSGCSGLLARELTEEVSKYRNQAFADSTKRTYRTHRDAYLRFCAIMKLPSVPASSHTICQYAAFLARSLSYSSVKQYLNVIALLHKEFGLPNPLAENWHVSSVLTGIKRVLGGSPQQKLPITVSLLLQLHNKLQLSCSVDASFWAICLVSFFGMFRKSHMVVSSASGFNGKQQFTKSDFRFFPWGMAILVRWSKTIQFRERQISIPLPRVPGSPLCPVSAVLHAFSFTASASPGSQAFMWLHPTSLVLQPFTYSLFLFKLRDLLSKCGLHGAQYGSHSFRRGGASFAFQSGIPLEFVKILGDWKSNAVLLYLTVPFDLRKAAVLNISQHIPR